MSNTPGSNLRYVRLCVLLMLLLCSLFLLGPMIPSSVPKDISWSTKVIDRNGETLRLFTADGGYWRFPTQLDTVDPSFIAHLIAYEDQRFWSHPGVDIFATARACYQLLTTGRVISGASTITMQTIRLLQPRPRTITSKLIEMFQAVQLELELSKVEILELYLSLAPYGGNIQGIEAACFFYFNTTPAHLTPSQSALLVSLPQSPETRRPDRSPQNAISGRNTVLALLHAKELLNSSQLKLALTQPVPKQKRPVPFHAPQLTRTLQTSHLLESIIPCTLEYQLQKKMENIAATVQKGLPPYQTIALMVVDNSSHEVLAHVGSGGFHISQMDLTHAVRSPGSTLKPFIYGLAFEKGILHPETKIFDSSKRFSNYGPKNFDKGFQGWVSVREALQSSLNIPAVHVLNQIGPQTLLSRFTNLDISLDYNEDTGLALALGGVGCTLVDLVEMYSSLANEGLFSPVIFQHTKENPAEQKLLSPGAAWYIDDILRTAPLPGYQSSNVNSLNRIRLKTGTSYGYRDAWAIGYNSKYTVGIWAGQIDGRYGKKTTGLNTAVPILLQIFENLTTPQKDTKGKKPPKNILPVSHSALPSHLQWFTDGDNIANRIPELTISYPVDNSVIQFENNLKIPLKTSGGIPPFHWLINGKIIGRASEGVTVFHTPEQPGKLDITLIDNKGKNDKVKVWIE
ncbi:MAG: penicillin-binding protein 1C [Desulfobulbaceae bacterium]|nr:penicillin-binding protein 1C [Desulfobulbaceae bacterium]